MQADLKIVSLGLSWVKAALDCKSWEWDGDQRAVAEHELEEAQAAMGRLEVASVPLTKADMAEALGCFWNAAIGAAHSRQGGMDVAAIMAEGIGAVAHSLTEPSVDPTTAGLLKAAQWVEQRQKDYVDEHGTTDPETNCLEFPSNGDEYVAELQEIIEGLQALVAP